MNLITLIPAGKDRWTALDGAYAVERRTEGGGWAYGGTAYLVTAVKLPLGDKLRHSWRASLAGALDAVTAHDQSGEWPA